MMDVWVRIVPNLDSEESTRDYPEEDGLVHYPEIGIRAGLCVFVYPTEDAAMEVFDRLGGLVLKLPAASLKGKSEFNSLVMSNRGDEAGPSAAYISVCYGSLAHRMVPNYGGHGPGEAEPQGDIAEFGEAANAWFDAFEAETGYSMHQ